MPKIDSRRKSNVDFCLVGCYFFSIRCDTNGCTESALQEEVLNFRFEIAEIKLGLIAQLPQSTEIGSQAAEGGKAEVRRHTC